MRKCFKIILITIIGLIIPFIIWKIIIGHNIPATFIYIVIYSYFIYLPTLCGWAGIKLFKVSGKIFLPTMIFDLFLLVVGYFSTEIFFSASDQTILAATIAAFLFWPIVFVTPVAPITAVIYKYILKTKFNKPK